MPAHKLSFFWQGEASPCAAMCSPAAARIRRYPLVASRSPMNMPPKNKAKQKPP